MPAPRKANLRPRTEKCHIDTFQIGEKVRVRREHGMAVGRIVRFEIIKIFPLHGKLPVVKYEDGTQGFVFNDMYMEKARK